MAQESGESATQKCFSNLAAKSMDSKNILLAVKNLRSIIEILFFPKSSIQTYIISSEPIYMVTTQPILNYLVELKHPLPYVHILVGRAVRFYKVRKENDLNPLLHIMF